MRTILVLAIILALAGCNASSARQPEGLHEPLPKSSWRKTPLHFGLYVTPEPEQNPISPPERFTGYHAATDLEIRRGEQNKEVPVFAVCEGEIQFSGFSEGYGGLITQFCTIDQQDVTVIYGHLAQDSLADSGVAAEPGQQIGVLGAEDGVDTDGTRKHLHLGMVKGHSSEVRGYVQTERELDLFIDPETVLRM